MYVHPLHSRCRWRAAYIHAGARARTSVRPLCRSWSPVLFPQTTSHPARPCGMQSDDSAPEILWRRQHTALPLCVCVCVCVCLCRCMLTPNQTWSGSCRSTRSVYVCVHVCVYIFLWPLLIPPARFRNDLLTVGVASGSIGTTDWTHLSCPGSWLDGVKGLCTRYVCL